MGFSLRNVLFDKKVVGNHRIQKYSSLPNSPSCTFKKVQKSSAILALLSGFQEMNLDW